MTFIATNIRLPEEELRMYRQTALERGKSFAQLVREALAKEVGVSTMEKRKKSKKRTFWDIGKYAIKGGGTHAARDHDEIIY